MARTDSHIALLHIPLGLTSAAATWLTTGVYFVTEKVLGWQRTENLLLSAGLGIIYIAGALTTTSVTSGLGRRRLLLGLYALLALLTTCLAFTFQPIPFVILIFLWTYLTAMNWPAMEALMCHGPDAATTSRRVGIFNINWAFTGAMAIISVSLLLKISPKLVFLSATAMHLVSWSVIYLYRERDDEPHAELHAEPELLRQRTLAKRLSRIALPGSYTILYSLTPLIASLPAVQALPEKWRSPAASVWLIGRFSIFALMSATSAWHTRPKLLVSAVLTMTGGFLLATISVPSLSHSAQLLQLIIGEALLGLAAGFIYYCSLYFGMVLSHAGDEEGGSTQQGGYHEALIGSGIVLGPGLGAAAHFLHFPPVVGVSTIVTLCAAGCVYTVLDHRRGRPGPSPSPR